MWLHIWKIAIYQKSYVSKIFSKSEVEAATTGSINWSFWVVSHKLVSLLSCISDGSILKERFTMNKIFLYLWARSADKVNENPLNGWLNLLSRIRLKSLFLSERLAILHDCPTSKLAILLMLPQRENRLCHNEGTKVRPYKNWSNKVPFGSANLLICLYESWYRTLNDLIHRMGDVNVKKDRKSVV